jgi:hypothetical protein
MVRRVFVIPELSREEWQILPVVIENGKFLDDAFDLNRR